MITVDLENLNPTTVFPLDDKGASITLRLMSTEVTKKIIKKTSKRKASFNKFGQPTFVYDDPDDKFTDEYIDYVIVDWTGIVDSNGVPIPCTRENKILLMNKAPNFEKKVNEFIRELTEADKSEREELEKN